MKKIMMFSCLLSFFIYAAAQQPIDETKVQKGVELMKKMMANPGEIMKIQAEIKELKLNSAEDAEMRKRMQKSASEMITKGKQQATTMSGVTENDVKKKMEEDKRIVPIKDVKRIAAVLKRKLTDAEIKKFCKVVHEAVKKQMDNKLIAQSETFYTKLKSQSSSATDIGKGAIGCYLTNLTKQSLYIMGRVCSEDNADATTLNNYAVLLTNFGVEEGALPLLNYLHNKYPKDPVVISNIAMAWLGLGDIKTAGKYADTCIQFFPSYAHQAHYIKSVEEESNGNRQGAVEQLKQSTGQVFSADKESQLKKWGGKLSSNYYKRNLPADALGLSTLNFPSFPKNIIAVFITSEDWRAFYSDIDDTKKDFEEKQRRLQMAANQNSKATVNEMMQKAMSNKGGYYFSANNNQNMGWWNFFNTITAEYALKEENFKKELAKMEADDLNMLDEMEQAIRTIEKQFDGTCGEGQQCPEEAICKAYMQAYDNYMSKAVPIFENFFQTNISFKRKAINEMVYAAKYCLPEIEYERFKIDKQLDYVRALSLVKRKFPDHANVLGGFGGHRNACIGNKQNPYKKKGLQRFEDIHCPPDWEINLPFSNGVSTNCTKITLKLGFIIGSASYTEDLLTNEWTNMTLELGKEIGSEDIIGKGDDVLVGANVGASGFIEIDRQGITDWGVKGTAGIGNDAAGVQVETKISLMAGKPSFGVKSDFNGAANEIAQAFR